MYSCVKTAILNGIEAIGVTVETDISEGMPVFDMVGYLSAEVKESRERVRTALKSKGYSLPVKRITVNLAPANVRKSGTGFDLPIAVSILASMGIVNSEIISEMMIVGELSLNGDVNGVNGILSMVISAKESGINICIVPEANYYEAKLIPDMNILPVNELNQVISFLENLEEIGNANEFMKNYDGCKDNLIKDNNVDGQYDLNKDVNEDNHDGLRDEAYDFANINGQKILRRACEVAISGMHNMLMVGPPGAGKSMIAKCIPSILPDLTVEEQIQISKIYSACGMFQERQGLMSHRPFRSPHHTISPYGLVGGGNVVKPGEISLANKGVLFLDELTEFNKATLEILRQPLEDKEVCISRVSGNYIFPADFILVAAMNPCNCGYYPDLTKCHCSERSLKNYRNKLSQPLLDRIDLCVQAQTVGFADLKRLGTGEPSKEIRTRVERMHEIQRRRYEGCDFRFNSQIPVSMLEKFCCLNEIEEKFMEQMYSKMNLTARTFHRVLRVARTIADMSGERDIKVIHLQEALCYRAMDKNFWGGDT
ncbi:MAG: YifB family Mg chelatase-like AAA ATPase [Lachnospiraceae bacterium]|nr:YifB family Mg chelatase-like AAA ATPase [Lachnospiraceae bacterium]